MKKAIITLGLILSFCLAFSIQVNSATPQLVNYQGRLTDSAGTTLDTTVSIMFTIYDDSTSGSIIWMETHTSVTVVEGLFNVLLGSVSTLVDTVFNDTTRYLGVKIDAGPEISPRSRFVTHPYAFRVSTIHNAEGGTVKSDIDLQGDLAVNGEVDVSGMENKIRFHYTDLVDLPTAAIYHGMFAHVHNEGKGYFAHAGAWVPLANEDHNHGWQDNGSAVELSNSSDSVGIGTSTPTEKLEVDGIIYSSSGGIKFPDATIQTTAAGGGGGGGWTDDGTAVRLTTVGDSVGIGTATPSEKLDVIGNAQISGKVTIGPGHSNTGTNSFVAGENNTASGARSTVSGGYLNNATDSTATVGGGRQNGAVAKSSTIAGGHGNSVSVELGSIGGGFQNAATNTATTVSGGSFGIASGSYSTVGGGSYNKARGQFSVVAGGGSTTEADSNHAGGNYSSIGGGTKNIASGDWSTVGGGELDSASGAGATVAGGSNNVASASSSTVGGGYSNSARNLAATIAGGYQNRAWGDYASVLGGLSNEAKGAYAVAIGGRFARADSAYSFAVGWRAHAMHRGSYVFADTAGSIDFNSTAANQFNIRAVGGTRIFSNSTLTTGVTLAAGAGAWVAVSDSAIKRNIRPVDEFDVLEKISRLPISRWSYETQSENIEHIGPMAQDFYAAFGLGDDERGICTIDPDGVSLAAIKALYEENKRLRKEMNNLQSETKAEILRLNEKLEMLIQNTGNGQEEKRH